MKLHVVPMDALGDGAVAAAVVAGAWRPTLRLTSREQGAVDEVGAPSMVLGRSGTGKTLCMVRRLLKDRAALGGKELLFVARSQALCTFVRDAVTSGDASAAGGPADARPAATRFLTVAELQPLIEAKARNMAAT